MPAASLTRHEQQAGPHPQARRHVAPGVAAVPARARLVGVPVAGWQIDCWLRDAAGRRVAALAVTPTDVASGRYELGAEPADTAGWPAGLLSGDIRYQDSSGRVMHTCTFTLALLDAVTTP